MIGDAAGRQQQLERVGQPLELESIEPSSRSTFDVEPILKLELCGGGSKVEAQGAARSRRNRWGCGCGCKCWCRWGMSSLVSCSAS